MAEASFDKANELFNAQDFEGAVKHFNKALKKVGEKDKFAVLCNRGACMMNMGHVEEALDSFEEALSVQPNHVEALHNKGVALSSMGQYKDAIKCYNEALKVSPSFFAAHCGKSEAYAHMNNFDESIACAQDAIAIDASQAIAYCDLGFAFLKKGQFENSIESYSKAIECGDDSAETQRLLGAAYTEQALVFEEDGSTEDAIRMYTQALKSQPDANGYHNKAVLLCRIDKEKNAIKSFEKALELNENLHETLAALGALYAKNNMAEEAIEVLEKAVRLQPDVATTRYNLALVYLKDGREVDAKEQLVEVIEFEPDNPDVMSALKLMDKEGVVIKKPKMVKKASKSGGGSYSRDITGGKGGSKKKGKGGKEQTYHLSKLQSAPFPPAVDPSCRPDFLSDSDFKRLFQMSRKEFAEMPQWKQVLKKKEHKLF